MRLAVHRIGLFVAGGLFLGGLAGCVTPSRRAGERPAVLRQLSPADRSAALGGNVRDDFDQDAVYIAWGAPSHVDTVRLPHRSYERWVYTHTENGVTSGYFGVSHGFAYPGGTGDDGRVFRGGYYGSLDAFYPAPLYVRGFPPPQTEVTYRQVVFAHGRVISYEPR